MLTDDPETRNSDALLFIRVWQRYYSLRNDSVSIRQLLELMREAPASSMQRYRAWLNQAPRFELLPTSWKIAKFRGVKREQWERHVEFEVGKVYMNDHKVQTPNPENERKIEQAKLF